MSTRFFCCSLFAILWGPIGSVVAEDTPPIPRVPVVDSEWWRICEMPDLGPLAGENPKRQHVVDHGLFQTNDGRWRLWACIRGTAVSRLLYGWEGKSLTEGPWKPLGVMARADEKFGERIRVRNGRREEQIGAPEFFRWKGQLACIYHSGGIRLMLSDDGETFRRADLGGDRGNLLYANGGRDASPLIHNGTVYMVSTISTTDGHGYVILRTSKDLKTWTKPKIISRGGIAGGGKVSAESPHLIFLNGYWYLFRASSITFKTYVYRSQDPFDFGVDDDSKLIATFKIKAPEVFEVDGQWYISDLADFQGIKLARLRWDRDR